MLRHLHTSILLLAALSAGPRANAGPSDSVDWERDVQPILVSRCVRCHGPDRSDGGLRLDAYEHLRAGGDSDLPIVTVAEQANENELRRRLSSDDPSYRMPWNEPPLPEPEVEVLLKWINDGSRGPSGWTKERIDQFEAAGDSANDGGWWDIFDDERINWLYHNPYAREFLIVLLLLQVGIVVVERLKQRERKQVEDEATIPRRFRRLGLPVYVAAFALWAAAFAVFWARGRVAAVLAERDASRQHAEDVTETLEQTVSPTTESVYGNPPRPIEKPHEPSLSGEYYRGNDERNPALFNGGYYRTATMQIALTDQEGEPVEYGDPVPEAGLFVRFDLEKPPGTTPALYVEHVIAKAVLSEGYPRNEADKSMPAGLESVEPGQRWRSLYRLPDPEAAGQLTGVVYVYYAARTEFAIVYEVTIEDGRIAEDSDVWMGNIFQFNMLVPPRVEGKIPQEEWFSDRPIPENTGEQVTDPKLLGLPEHAPDEPSSTTD